MSKVVHLSDDAHASAKRHCQRSGLKMSEWVAVLIERATAEAAAGATGGRAPAAAAPAKEKQPPPRRAAVVAPQPTETSSAAVDGALPLYAAPPFWARGPVGKAPLADSLG